CLGAAVELGASADLAVAAADARFGMPEVAIGIPSVIEAALLVPVVGLARARELVLTAETIDAEEAWRIGLVNRVVPSDELEAEVRRLAERLLANSPAAMAQQKALIARWLATGNLDEAIRGSIDSFAVAFASGEPARRLAARRRR
ncbi:MAG: enoyl-CoA hydratase/isomerase family protein, partial [Clostridia bacterium]|nr:enoyl-CoA hydratase/isomerase family protein [Clostridia bacterium]